ncbi:hypothetical protein [Blastopirellula marina]|nr:hypothetical protein [Blastopirellula marina]
MSDTTFDFVDHPHFLEYITSGDPSESEWMDLLRMIVQQIEHSGKMQVLVDATRLTVLPESMVRYRMGIRTGEAFHARVRVALVHPPVEDDNFWETVARNRGAMARSGTDRAELIAWLMEDLNVPYPGS